MRYSNSPVDGFLYLYNPAWVTDDGKYLELKIHGLFLVKSRYIESIEFTNLTADNAEDTSPESPHEHQD